MKEPIIAVCFSAAFLFSQSNQAANEKASQADDKAIVESRLEAGSELTEKSGETVSKDDKSSAAERRIGELLKSLNTYQANFRQRVFDNRKRVVNQNSGVFTLARPNRFRWHVTQPYEELIIANGSELWAIDYDLDQVTAQTLSQSIGDTPALLLANSQVNLGETFTIRYIGSDAEGRESYKLIPKDGSSLFEYVNMVFKKDVLEQLRLKDSLGQTTAVLFEQATMNPPVETKLFEFKPDPKMDFIDSREPAQQVPAGPQGGKAS